MSHYEHACGMVGAEFGFSGGWGCTATLMRTWFHNIKFWEFKSHPHPQLSGSWISGGSAQQPHQYVLNFDHML